MMNFHFEKKFKEDRIWFERNFKKILEKYLDGLQYKYKRIVLYPLFPSGKYIRPALMFSSAEMLGIKKAEVLYPACCIELIHNYSLIHDDLPCMDNDDYRRGRLALHKKFSESDAVLTGDGLLTLSFEILSDWKKDQDIVIKSIKLVSNYAGLNGLIKGQLMDLESKKFLGKNKKFLSLYIRDLSINKTAKLIEAAVTIPAFVASLDNKKIKILKEIGKKIGLLFQVTDDLIDFLSGQDKESLCYPSLIGINGTKNFIEQLKKDIICKIDKEFSKNNGYLKYLIEKISTRTV
ncbi:MAG: polyprenyl synthetase family protein [Endomicrobiia bacterium]